MMAKLSSPNDFCIVHPPFNDSDWVQHDIDSGFTLESGTIHLFIPLELPSHGHWLMTNCEVHAYCIPWFHEVGGSMGEVLSHMKKVQVFFHHPDAMTPHLWINQ